MAKYPIKMLKDEDNVPFVPLVGTDAIVDPSGKTLEERLLIKLGPDNLKAGDNVKIETEDYDCYISVDLPGGLNLIDNLDTEESGQGSLDAHQGKILKESIPDIVNNLTTVDANKGLSAYQGYLLSNRFNNYTTTSDMNIKFDNYLLKTGGTLTGDITVKQGTTDEPTVRVDNGTYQLDMIVGSGGINRGLYDRKSGKYLIYADVNDAVTVSGHATSDLALTGGTLSGNLTISKDNPILAIYSTNTTAQVIKMGNMNYKYNLVTSYGNSTTYGANTAIQSGGALALGGGEAATTLLSTIGASTYDVENLFAVADGAVYLESNCQDINNRLGFVLTSAGELLPVKKEIATTSSGTIGNASYKLKGLYVDDIYLSTGTHSIKGAGNKDVLRDHGNGSVTLDATGGDLYLGWQTGNTNRINIFNGKMFITQYGGARIEPQTNTSGTWISMTHGGGAALYNGVRNGASSGSNASALWGIKTQNGAWGCGVLSGSDALYFAYGTDSNYNSGTDATANAYISSAGAFTSASARKTKENIQPYTDKALDIINDTLICSFNYKADNNKSYRVGFIADDTNSIMSGEEHDSFDINNTVGLLLKAVQELSEENKQLKERIEKIEG